MENLNDQKSCCLRTDSEKSKKGLFAGLLCGLIPHTFCILFIIFSILGVSTATFLLKPLLLNPYFFYILVGLSIFLATISAIIYLKKNGILSLQGAKRKWKYLSTLYVTTISVNLLFFTVIFPYLANLNQSKPTVFVETVPLSSITLKVNIPCPGHAPLIINELKKIAGVENVRFNFPNFFEVKYNPSKTLKERILSLDVFNTYKAEIIKEEKENFQTEREKLLSQLYSTIEKAKIEGKYKCCIEPPCTMCYLGEWIFEDGTCNCDGMIAKGEWDNVCPQCIRGIKEGRCKSKIGTCPIL